MTSGSDNSSIENNGTIRLETHLIGDFVQIGLYSFLVAFGVPLNLLTFHRASKRYHVTRVRIYLLQMNLNISDLMVLLFHAFFRVCWLSTYQFYGGSLMCKIMKFLDNLGLTFSSNVIVCIGVDRLMSLDPTSSVSQRLRKVKIGLGMAWISAILSSAPQLGIWTIMQHPSGREWYQCVAVFKFHDQNASNSTRELMDRLETVYSLAFILISFWIPCVIIVLCYSLIFRQVSSKLSNDGREFYTVRYTPNGSELYLAGKIDLPKRTRMWRRFRRNYSAEWPVKSGYDANCGGCTQVGNRGRCENRGKSVPTLGPEPGTSLIMCAPNASPASIIRQQCLSRYSYSSRGEDATRQNVASRSQIRIRRRRYHTLIVSSALVAVYFVCWLPYNILQLWQGIDKHSYHVLEDHIYFLYGLIVLNSLINPLIYGHLDVRNMLRNFLARIWIY